MSPNYLLVTLGIIPRMDKEVMRRLEEMEEQSERWRTERRRMNAEIDKLEAALADAKAATPSKRTGAPNEQKPQGIDPVAFVRMQEAADEKLKKATEEWEAERTKLLSQINRLEAAVAEAIARASNPMRATQSVKEQFEVELNKTVKEKTEIERQAEDARRTLRQEAIQTAEDIGSQLLQRRVS